MKALLLFAALVVFVAAATPMPLDSVTLQIEFPNKKEDRHQQYWFLTMARGYAI
jgi:hypothetical protein